MKHALINFRVRPSERQQLRVVLLQEGQTLQEFFASIVRKKLCQKPSEAMKNQGKEYVTR